MALKVSACQKSPYGGTNEILLYYGNCRVEMTLPSDEKHDRHDENHVISPKRPAHNLLMKILQQSNRNTKSTLFMDLRPLETLADGASHG